MGISFLKCIKLKAILVDSLHLLKSKRGKNIAIGGSITAIPMQDMIYSKTNISWSQAGVLNTVKSIINLPSIQKRKC